VIAVETTKSADGTVIAYDRTGEGPALIVALGAFCDRKSFVPPESLTSVFTVYTYDRRGRGDSGDTQPYSVEREIEDLAAVASVASVASAGSSGSSGGPVFVYGHSSGAALALRAAAAGVPIARIVAYEAPFIVPGSRPVADDPGPRIREMVEAGRRGDAVRYWMTDVVQAPPYDIELTAGQGIPADLLATITVPVLVVGGGKSPDWFRRAVRETAAAIPGARLVTVEGHDHGVPPEVIAPVLAEFFLGRA
jgi:pimeloyl-ACP methyl ester carboxylesterase